VKYGRDYQKPDQKLYEQSINQAGGVYIIIRSLGDLMAWYDEFNSNPL
jgi:hypothetical protein